jgi:hypothetical protein
VLPRDTPRTTSGESEPTAGAVRPQPTEPTASATPPHGFYPLNPENLGANPDPNPSSLNRGGATETTAEAGAPLIASHRRDPHVSDQQLLQRMDPSALLSFFRLDNAGEKERNARFQAGALLFFYFDKTTTVMFPLLLMYTS